MKRSPTWPLPIRRSPSGAERQIVAGRRAPLVGRLLLLATVALTGCDSAPSNTAVGRETDDRIRFHEQQVELHPRHYAAWAELAAAHLARARETHSADDVQRARAAAERSIGIQPSFAGLMSITAVSNFAHRFETALAWADRADAAAPEPGDEQVLAERVESLLGLDRIEEAWQAIQSAGDDDAFFVAAARGQVLAAEGRPDEAVQSFLVAERAALGQGAVEMAAWAQVSAGGVRLDAGDLERARTHLAAAAALSPESLVLRLHEAELLEAEGRREDALSLYEQLASATGDPTLHARAHAAALAVGAARAAKRHFVAAEAGFLAAIDAGEVYTLGALAALYADAGVRLDEARELARRNLEYTRDQAAHRLLSSLEAKASSVRAR